MAALAGSRLRPAQDFNMRLLRLGRINVATRQKHTHQQVVTSGGRSSRNGIFSMAGLSDERSSGGPSKTPPRVTCRVEHSATHMTTTWSS